MTVKAGQSSSRNSHQLWLPVTVAALGSLALLPYISHTGNERLEPGTLPTHTCGNSVLSTEPHHINRWVPIKKVHLYVASGYVEDLSRREST